MADLRSTQLEVLQRANWAEVDGVTPHYIGIVLDTSTRAARKRLDNLAFWGYLQKDAKANNGNNVYRLTPAGQRALEGEGS